MLQKERDTLEWVEEFGKATHFEQVAPSKKCKRKMHPFFQLSNKFGNNLGIIEVI